MRFLALVSMFAAICVAYFRFYPELSQTEQVRYRLTVRVGTPNGDRTGSGVWGYSKAPVFDVPVFSMKWNFSGRVEGEAIPIDIGNGRVIYMVLGGRVMPQDLGAGLHPARFNPGFMNTMPSTQLWQGGLGVPEYGSDREGAQREVAWIKARHGKIVTLDCTPVLHRSDEGYCPAMVFTDSKGKHFELLDPDDLKTTLGPGYRLLNVTLQVVADPITRGIERRLPWVKPAPNGFGSSFLSLDEEIRKRGFSRKDTANFR